MYKFIYLGLELTDKDYRLAKLKAKLLSPENSKLCIKVMTYLNNLHVLIKCKLNREYVIQSQ